MTCPHDNTVSSKRTTFCLDCDQIIVVPKPTETRYPRPQDNPLVGWRTMDDMPPIDEVYWAAWLGPLRTGWHIVRVLPGDALPHPATHWRYDCLGVPGCTP